MIKITIIKNMDKEEYNFSTEKDALTYMNSLIDDAIRLEKEYLDDMEGDAPEAIEKIEELEGLDRNNIYELEWNTELILGEYAEVEIEEYNYYIVDVLNELGLYYDKSTMSKSIYVENEEGLLIRISDHSTPKISKDYGHQVPDVELTYKNGIINNEDINKYLGTNLKDEIVLL